jgi:murein DD-endopeptidase MepM/ murein hydrolase activator NlpD
MSQINVSCGQFVSVGQIVGLVGNTGNSSGPHLHFEIRYNDEATDPTQTIGF